jgi:integrase
MATKITKSVVDNAKPAESDYFIWDSELSGFGVRIAKGGRKAYVCQYRAGDGRRAPSRRMTIGPHGSPWTADQARTKAKQVLGRAANGEDPAKDKQEAKKEMTVAELCDLYIKQGCTTKKASTIATDKGRIERHIKPLLGRRKIGGVLRSDVKKFMSDVANGKTAADVKTKKQGRAIVRGGKGTATRTVGLLGGIFSYAVDASLVESNPARGVKRFADKKGTRFLSQEELKRLGDALQLAERDGLNSFAMAILKLLIFTGARKGEIEGIRWSEIDFEGGFLRLGDSKTGQKIVMLNAGALQVLNGLTRVSESDFVFPAFGADGHYVGTPKIWRQVKNSAGLEDVRLHDLRHSFASVAVSGGATLPIIGALLGHKDNATTMRYAHLSDDPLKAASEFTGNKIASALYGEVTDNVTSIRSTKKN